MSVTKDMIILIKNSTSVKDIWALKAFDLTSTVTTLIIKSLFWFVLGVIKAEA